MPVFQKVQNSIKHTLLTLTALLWSWQTLPAQEQRAGQDRLPAPPFEMKFLPGWQAEHLAFAIGQNDRAFGGPARWAVGGSWPQLHRPAEQFDELYLGQEGQRLYFHDKRRFLWKLEDGEVWPIAGGNDLADTLDGPGPFAGFLAPGVYGGGYMSVVAAGHLLYINDNGRLRKVARQSDGSWKVETVAGRGKRGSLKEGEKVPLAELGPLGKGMTMDPQQNLYLTLGGGLVKVDSRTQMVTSVVTRKQVQRDLEAVYAQKWPGTKPRQVSIGSGEGVDLVWYKDGSIYIGGRTWPDAAKVTPEGKYVPIVGYCPVEKEIKDARWGMGDPACYRVHCSFGFFVDRDGVVIARNEIPGVCTRYLPDRVEVLRKDGTWGVGGDYWKLPGGIGAMSPDGVFRQNGPPGPYPSRTIFYRIRQMK